MSPWLKILELTVFIGLPGRPPSSTTTDKPSMRGTVRYEWEKFSIIFYLFSKTVSSFFLMNRWKVSNVQYPWFIQCKCAYAWELRWAQSGWKKFSIVFDLYSIDIVLYDRKKQWHILISWSTPHSVHPFSETDRLQHTLGASALLQFRLVTRTAIGWLMPTLSAMDV